MLPRETPPALNELLHAIAVKETGRDETNVKRVKLPTEKPKQPLEQVIETVRERLAKGRPRLSEPEAKTVLAEIARFHDETPGGVLGQTFFVNLEQKTVGVHVSKTGMPHLFMAAPPKK